MEKTKYQDQVMSARTPGPWTVRPPAPMEHHVEVYSDHEGGCKVAYATTHADARLMAAAPELLIELRAIVDGWTAMVKNVRTLTPWELERLEFASEVIAKAEGGKQLIETDAREQEAHQDGTCDWHDCRLCILWAHAGNTPPPAHDPIFCTSCVKNANERDDAGER